MGSEELAAEPEARFDFLLGQRDFDPPDFDGRLRRCVVTDRLWFEGVKYTRIRVDPPLPVDSVPAFPHLPPAPVTELVLQSRYAGQIWDVESFEHVFCPVYLFQIVDVANLDTRGMGHGATALYANGHLGHDPDLLPRTDSQQFEHGYSRLARFAEENGHLELPGTSWTNPLIVFAGNVRYEEAGGRLSADRKARLEQLPGWWWLPGDAFFLINQYAIREGHTDVPLDHEEMGQPLGRGVEHMRRDYWKGYLSKDRIERLEAIPHWHW